MKKILFVCTGNSCRSVMAEGLMKALTAERKDLQISSAGISAIDGFSATFETIRAMQEEGIDVSGHRSQRATPKLVQEADRIFVMEHAHKDWLLRMVPQARDKVSLLSEFASGEDIAHQHADIPDPIRMSENFYRNVLHLIKGCVKNISENI